MKSDEEIGDARWAPGETILIANRAAPTKPNLLIIRFMASATLVADYESVATTRIAGTAGVHVQRQPFDQFLELAALVEP